jgi:vacuolar protein sorting-associated protein 33A
MTYFFLSETMSEMSSTHRFAGSLGSHHKKTTIVFFLGGCTFTEVSAIRFLAQQDEGVRDYLVATTQMINGSTLLESVIQSTPFDRGESVEQV